MAPKCFPLDTFVRFEHFWSKCYCSGAFYRVNNHFKGQTSSKYKEKINSFACSFSIVFFSGHKFRNIYDKMKGWLFTLENVILTVTEPRWWLVLVDLTEGTIDMMKEISGEGCGLDSFYWTVEDMVAMYLSTEYQQTLADLHSQTQTITAVRILWN